MVKDPSFDPFGPIATARKGFKTAQDMAQAGFKRGKAIPTNKPATPTLKFSKPLKRSNVATPTEEPGETLGKFARLAKSRKKRSFLDQ